MQLMSYFICSSISIEKIFFFFENYDWLYAMGLRNKHCRKDLNTKCPNGEGKRTNWSFLSFSFQFTTIQMYVSMMVKHNHHAPVHWCFHSLLSLFWCFKGKNSERIWMDVFGLNSLRCGQKQKYDFVFRTLFVSWYTSRLLLWNTLRYRKEVKLEN